MALYDRNRDGEKDIIDNYLEYNIYKQSAQNNNSNKYNHNYIHNENNEPKKLYIGKKLLYDPTKDSDRVVVIKCLLGSILCFGASALYLFTDMSEFLGILCILAAIGLTILILKV